MNIPDHEFEEWHKHVLRQRERYKWLLQDIISGVPTIVGMASDYRPMTLKEIRQRAEELLQ